MGLRRRKSIEQLKSRYYARLNVHQNDQFTNKIPETESVTIILHTQLLHHLEVVCNRKLTTDARQLHMF